MRLFGKVDSAINDYDRAEWFAAFYDLSWLPAVANAPFRIAAVDFSFAGNRIGGMFRPTDDISPYQPTGQSSLAGGNSGSPLITPVGGSPVVQPKPIVSASTGTGQSSASTPGSEDLGASQSSKAQSAAGGRAEPQQGPTGGTSGAN